MGSGTTAEACFNTNRQCIGSEINEDYAKESLERMKSL
jgi:site-specific DNA-methyltransferase (adenine-specific)